MTQAPSASPNPGAQPNPGGLGSPPPAKKSGSGWITLIVLAIVAVPVLGIVASIGIYAVSKYLMNSKQAEARTATTRFAAGIGACPGGLPETTAAVPAAPPSGSKYQSSPTDWSGHGFTCASFSMTAPQYFSYQWVREGPSSGRVVAKSDVDGNGHIESHFEVEVTCVSGSCSPGPVRQVPVTFPDRQ